MGWDGTEESVGILRDMREVVATKALLTTAVRVLEKINLD